MITMMEEALAKRGREPGSVPLAITPQGDTKWVGALPKRPSKGVGTFSYIPSIRAEQGEKEGRERHYTLDTLNHPIKKYLSKVFFFFGPRGRSKSLSMTFWFWVLRALYDQIYGPEERYCPICSKVYRKETFHRPIRIATNYKCDFADIQDPYLVDKLMAYPPWAHDLDIGIDELGVYVPAARAMSSTALNVGTWLQQIRKRHINIYMATQFAQDITRNVLRQVDLFLEPESFDDGHNVFLYPYDLWGYYTGRMEYQRWPPRREDAFTLPILQRDTWRVFGLYNTEEIFAPIWSNQRDTMVDEQGYTFGDQVSGSTDILALNDMSVWSLDELLRQESKRTGVLNIGNAFTKIKDHPEAAEMKRVADLERFLTENRWKVDKSQTGYNKHTAEPPQ